MIGARETMDSRIAIRFAAVDDVELIFDFIRRLAEYEKLAHEVVADGDILRRNLHRDSLEIYADHLLKSRDHQSDSRPFHCLKLAEREHDKTFIFHHPFKAGIQQHTE